MRTVLFFIFIWLIHGQSIGQKLINPFSKFFSENDSLAAEHEAGILIVPLLYYTPDTRLAAGAIGVYYFHLGNKDNPQNSTRLSYVKLLADYTQNRQLDVWSSWNIFTNNEKYLIKGELRFRDFPDRFYGIGNNTSKLNQERFQYNLFSTKLLVLRKLGNKIFAGADISYENEYDFKLSDTGQLRQGDIRGYNGGTAVGPGFVFILDTRDNVINSTKGYIFETSTYFYNKSLGSTFEYRKWVVEHSYFKKLSQSALLAFNTKFQFSEGEVPFLDMPRLGSDQILRGYPSYRYRDKNFMATQAEWRQQIYGRWGTVAFLGAGDVFESELNLDINLLKFSVGGGLRYMVDKKERLNIRLDFGVGRNSNGFYVMLTEAF